MSVRTAANNPLIAAGVNWPVQFYVPKIAARALDQLAIHAKAKAAGVERYTFELSEFKTPPTKARITANAQLTPAETLIGAHREFRRAVEARYPGHVVGHIVTHWEPGTNRRSRSGKASIKAL